MSKCRKRYNLGCPTCTSLRRSDKETCRARNTLAYPNYWKPCKHLFCSIRLDIFFSISMKSYSIMFLDDLCKHKIKKKIINYFWQSKKNPHGSDRKSISKRSKPSYFMAILGVTIVLFFVGIFGWVLLNASHYIDKLKEEVQVQVYLRNNVRKKILIP